MKNVRMSRTVHAVPRQGNKQTNSTDSPGDPQTHRTGRVGLDNGQMIAHTKETRPFGSSTGKYPLTPRPTPAAEDVNNGREGPVRGRQADKS